MAGNSENKAYNELANRYIEHYGELLKEENALLDQREALRITPRMDSSIRRLIRSGSIRRYAAGLAVAAAAFALILILPSLLNLYNVGAPSANAPDQYADTAMPYEILPLSFTLPDNLSVEDVKQDKGKTVYYLVNSELDHICMTMETNPEDNVFAGLKETSIKGSTVYYKYTVDFSVMAFEKQDITYVLSCRYDVNTLADLAEIIL